MMDGSSSHRSNVSEPADIYDDETFLIKVQVRQGNIKGPLLIYDRDRSF